MARHKLCEGCREGDHSLHDGRGTAPLGMMGGEACMCRGDCIKIEENDPEVDRFFEAINAMENEGLKPITDLPQGPNTPGYTHIMKCPACEKEVSGGLMYCQPFTEDIIVWWHSECREKVETIFEEEYREALIEDIAKWLEGFPHDDMDDKSEARALLKYIML